MTEPVAYTIFTLLKTARLWLDLEPGARFAFIEGKIKPILDANQAVSMRFFDSESYSARVTDVVVWETTDLGAYHRLIKSLRDTAFWDRYFEVLEIIPAVEDAYASYYGIAPLTSASQESKSA
jgi:hypothetical protein